MNGVIIGVAIALVIIIIARRWDKRRHEDKLRLIQERIRRREEGATETEDEESAQ